VLLETQDWYKEESCGVVQPVASPTANTLCASVYCTNIKNGNTTLIQRQLTMLFMFQSSWKICFVGVNASEEKSSKSGCVCVFGWSVLNGGPKL